MFGVLLTAVRLGNVDPEILHQTFEVLLKQILPSYLEDGKRNQEYCLDALQKKHVQNSKYLREKSVLFLIEISGITQK